MSGKGLGLSSLLLYLGLVPATAVYEGGLKTPLIGQISFSNSQETIALFEQKFKSIQDQVTLMMSSSSRNCEASSEM